MSTMNVTREQMETTVSTMRQLSEPERQDLRRRWLSGDPAAHNLLISERRRRWFYLEQSAGKAMRIGLILLMLLPAIASAQNQVRANWLPVRFSNLTYTASGADTSASQSMAAASKLSLVIATADSAELDVYVQYKDSNATWTTKFTDSLLTTVNTGKTQEYVLKRAGLDVFDAMVYGVRVVIAARATGCGVTSPTFTATWWFRP